MHSRSAHTPSRRRGGSREFLARSAACAAALWLTYAPATFAAEPATAPSSQATDLELREWVVFIVDAGQPNASGRTMFNATLPPFMTSRRENAAAGSDNRPTPMGVIRFVGEVERDVPVDVLLTLPNTSDVQATWPKAQVRPNRILWNNVYTDENAKAADLDAKHWMAALRRPGPALIRSGNQAERFLMYDVAFPYKAPLQLKLDPGGTIRATNTGGPPLLDLTFYKKKDNAWTRATIASLGGRPDAVPPAAGKKDGPATKPGPDAAFDAAPATQPDAARKRAMLPTTRRSVPATEGGPVTQPAAARGIVEHVESVTVWPAPAADDPRSKHVGQTTITAGTLTPATAPATTQATPGPAPSAAGAEAVVFEPVTGDDTALLVPWTGTLTNAGVLPGDVDTVVSVLKAHGLHDRWMTAIYRLDPAEMDRLLPIEVVPTPRKITRVGLVIVRGMDPSINEEIDRLIKQCGDPDYAKRKAATAELISLGEPAKAKVEKAVNDKDPEISQRAERILEAITKKKG